MQNAHSEFDIQEQLILERLEREVPVSEGGGFTGEQPAELPAEPTEPNAQQPASEPVAAEPQPAASAVPAVDPAQQGGDPRAALRASRHAERQARLRAETAERRVAELEASNQPAPAQAPDELTDEQLAELEQDMPAVATVYRHSRATAARIAAVTPAAPPAPEPEFIAPLQSPDVQDAVDAVPALQAWQSNPDQSRWLLAVKHDEMLRLMPAWKDKPLADRLAEASRRVHADLGAAPVLPARRDPAHVIANAPLAQPLGVGDFRGGAAPGTQTKDYRGMSDEALMASLPS